MKRHPYDNSPNSSDKAMLKACFNGVIPLEEISLEELREAVRIFALENQQYKSPGMASGQCVAASMEFIQILYESTSLFDSEHVQEVDWRWNESGDIDQGPPLPHNHFRDNEYKGHTAVVAYGYYIDFTARQFAEDGSLGEDIPFPLIWTTPCSRHRYDISNSSVQRVAEELV